MEEKLEENPDIYFDDDCLIEDDYYRSIKDLIKCNFCHKILHEPMMCLDCQAAFCKNCKDELENINHKCEKPSYVQNKSAISLIGQLKYLCKNCKSEIKEIDIENHLKEDCLKNENPSKLINAIYRKKALKKLNRQEIKSISEQNKKVNHISGKKNKILIFITFSSFYFSNIIRKRWSWEIILS